MASLTSGYDAVHRSERDRMAHALACITVYTGAMCMDPRHGALADAEAMYNTLTKILWKRTSNTETVVHTVFREYADGVVPEHKDPGASKDTVPWSPEFMAAHGRHGAIVGIGEYVNAIQTIVDPSVAVRTAKESEFLADIVRQVETDFADALAKYLAKQKTICANPGALSGQKQAQ